MDFSQDCYFTTPRWSWIWWGWRKNCKREKGSEENTQCEAWREGGRKWSRHPHLSPGYRTPNTMPFPLYPPTHTAPPTQTWFKFWPLWEPVPYILGCPWVSHENSQRPKMLKIALDQSTSWGFKWKWVLHPREPAKNVQNPSRLPLRHFHTFLFCPPQDASRFVVPMDATPFLSSPTSNTHVQIK